MALLLNASTVIWVTSSGKWKKDISILTNSGHSVVICRETQECIDYIQKHGASERIVGIITSMMHRHGRKQKGFKNGLEMIQYIKQYLAPSMKTTPIFAMNSATVDIAQCLQIGIDIIIEPQLSRNPNAEIQQKLIEKLKQNIDKWHCPQCTFINTTSHSMCSVCTFSYTSCTTWACPKCTFCNQTASSQSLECVMCRYSPQKKKSISSKPKPQNTQFFKQYGHLIKCPDVHLNREQFQLQDYNKMLRCNDANSVKKIHIVHISDTHRKYAQFSDIIPYEPNCINILIHSGDFSGRLCRSGALPNRLIGFSQWFRNLPHQKKIIISGNHDYVCSSLSKKQIQNVVFKGDPNVLYLQDDMVNLYGIKIYGTPWNHQRRMSFGANTEKMKEKWKLIPNDTDILISHQPPFDKYLELCKEKRGNVDLWKEVVHRIQPKYHLFGHDHDYIGYKRYRNIIFINSAMQFHEIPHEFDIIFDSKNQI